MNVLFLTLCEYNSIQEKDIYTDLLREFINRGHEVYMISPIERRWKKRTHMIREDHSKILRLKTGNTQKTNMIEKGISTLLIDPLFKHALRKYYSKVKFDLIMYSTPPITLVSAVEYIKKRDNARTYLLLKDIFPQNAADIGMIKENGYLYRIFRKKEERLYKISDRIGCMSPANVRYIQKNNSFISPETIEVCPNCIEIEDKSVDPAIRNQIREKYGIPVDKKIFIYGGNLGKPQGIPFLIECIKVCQGINNVVFLIIGDGTEYNTIEKGIKEFGLKNAILQKRLPKEDYDTMVGACDVGMLFLDHRFTIPNFPSRLLSYMQAKMPVLAVTDPNTDVGQIIVEGGFGWWCESNDALKVSKMIKEILLADTQKMGLSAYHYLLSHYSVANGYEIIMKGIV